jgi:YegS/Rv2252/BmrU family lipid kinase
VERQLDLVIVAAGDGSIEDVVPALVGSDTALGIIPIGTMNNIARALGVPLTLEDACALLGMGITREIDAGQVQTNGKGEIEYFLESAGVGLTAIAIPAGQAAEKHRWDLLPNALRKLFDAEPANLTIELDDGQVMDLKSEVVTVSNSPLLGDNILIAPDAKMDDGQLDIATYAGMGKTDLLGYFIAASKGKRAQDPRVVFHRAKHVSIQSQQPVDAHSDKEVVEGKQVLDIKIVPKALRIVAGKGIALTYPIDDVPSQPPLAGPQSKSDEQAADKPNLRGNGNGQ